jgi:predicted Zn-dependent protease
MKRLYSAWNFRSAVAVAVLAGVSLAGAVLAARTGPQARAAAEKSPVLAAMEQELERSMSALKTADPAPYFLSYTITEQQRAEVQGSNGALLSSQEQISRWLEAQVRVGSYEMDNTRKVGEREPNPFASAGVAVPIEDDILVLRRAIWLETDRQYHSAAEALIKIRTGREVKVQTAEGEAPDFSREDPQVSIAPRAAFQLDRRPWEDRVRRITRVFHDSSAILNSIVTFSALAQNQYQASSEGTRLQFGQVRYRLELYVQSKAPDGMDINRYFNYDWVNPADAPKDDVVLAQARTMIREVEGLRAAPLVEPFAGPAILTGRAAAVFFHEVFGHRAEGHRQKDITEGQTFTRKVGEQVMPEFISIYDDPTQPRQGAFDLLGFYPYDDEGVPAQRVVLVENGILRNFLMSRSPLVGFPKSNGHGRRQPGYAPLSRQGNLIVSSKRAVSDVKLRQMLVEEIRRQGKPFGLVIDDIAGGFTFTGRGLPQAFQVLPLVVYRVYPDGRADELVRGVDLVGTPLLSLTKIIASGDKPEVFNGYCGADSGSVPVAAVSPAILISELEVQKKETSTDKPPILPHPAHDPAAKKPVREGER